MRDGKYKKLELNDNNNMCSGCDGQLNKGSKYAEHAGGSKQVGM